MLILVTTNVKLVSMSLSQRNVSDDFRISRAVSLAVRSESKELEKPARGAGVSGSSCLASCEYNMSIKYHIMFTYIYIYIALHDIASGLLNKWTCEFPWKQCALLLVGCTSPVASTHSHQSLTCSYLLKL